MRHFLNDLFELFNDSFGYISSVIQFAKNDWEVKLRTLNVNLIIKLCTNVVLTDSLYVNICQFFTFNNLLKPEIENFYKM